jgi:hypothetical protein
MPFCSRVMQMEPPPMPTLMKSAPQSAKEAEALGVDHVASADLDLVAVLLANPVERELLPLGEALGRVDAEHVGARIEKLGDALGVVARVDAGADEIALVGIEELVGVFLVGVVVLAEDEETGGHLGRRWGAR